MSLDQVLSILTCLTYDLDHIKQLPDKEREQELGKLRHCAVMLLAPRSDMLDINMFLYRDGFH